MTNGLPGHLDGEDLANRTNKGGQHMGQQQNSDRRDEYTIAKALNMAIHLYALYQNELRTEADVADMRRIHNTRYPRHAQLLQGPGPEVTDAAKQRRRGK